MKYIFSLFLVCASYFSFGQMTVSEMAKVYNMDLDQFETYAISKGYVFEKLYDEEYFYGHSYRYGFGKNTKYLTLYTKFSSTGTCVTYQTSNPTEFLNIKKEMKNLGFILIKEESFEGQPSKIYSNNKYEITIYTTDRGNYEISINK